MVASGSRSLVVTGVAEACPNGPPSEGRQSFQEILLRSDDTNAQHVDRRVAVKMRARVRERMYIFFRPHGC